jgi:hypothetical protein
MIKYTPELFMGSYFMPIFLSPEDGRKVLLAGDG